MTGNEIMTLISTEVIGALGRIARTVDGPEAKPGIAVLHLEDKIGIRAQIGGMDVMVVIGETPQELANTHYGH